MARVEPWWRDLHTDGEEWLNGLIHAGGFLLAVLASGCLLASVIPRGESWLVASCVVYCLSLLGVFAASTLSHWVRQPTWRHRLRSWDQGLIFLFIVATFTPIALVYLSGWWNGLTVLLWALGIAGFCSKVVHTHRVDRIVLWFYLALGWGPVLTLPTLWSVVPGLVALLLAGGLAYTLGSILLVYDRRQPYFHAGWHVFVLLGSGVHFAAIWIYVLPRAT